MYLQSGLQLFVHCDGFLAFPHLLACKHIKIIKTLVDVMMYSLHLKLKIYVPQYQIMRNGMLLILPFAFVVSGGTVITVMRITLKHIFTFTFEHIYSFLGLRTFSSSQYRKEMPPNPKHYTKDFKIPPISVSTRNCVTSNYCCKFFTGFRWILSRDDRCSFVLGRSYGR